MRFFLTALFLMVCSLLPDIAVGDITTNRVLMVDQDGTINIPEVLATQAQVSSNMTAAAIAEAKASAAMEAAAEGSNLVADVVQQITEGQLVVYRQGWVDSITSAVELPPGTRCVVTGLEPSVARRPDGLDEHRMTYAVTSRADEIVPEILWASTLAGGRDALLPLPADRVGPAVRVAGGWTSPDGTSFPYLYRVSFFTSPSPAGYAIVYLGGDASDGSAVFAISGGISGGATAEVPCGSRTLVFRGGLLVGVREEAAGE